MPTLHVLAGPTLDTMKPISELVNTGKPIEIKSEHFEGSALAYIKGFNGEEDCDYFKSPNRQGVTWSIQVQGLEEINQVSVV